LDLKESALQILTHSCIASLHSIAAKGLKLKQHAQLLYTIQIITRLTTIFLKMLPSFEGSFWL
jgi:hypothetical protein